MPDDNDEKHIDFEANVGGKPLSFRMIASPNKKYGPGGIDISLRHDREQMLYTHGRDINENERQFALLSTLWLALRELTELKAQKLEQQRILEKDKGRWDIDE